MDHLTLRILSELILPPLGPFLLLALAFVLYAARWRRTGIALGIFSVVTMFALSSIAVNSRLNEPWPEIPERVEAPYPPADAIVVLGGGRYLEAPEYGGNDTAAAGSLERLRYAAKIQRETGKPILVTGGRPGDIGTHAEAIIMRDILQEEFHVPVQWVEDRAEDTAENARYSAELLRAAGIERIYLVTHGFHMPRAQEEFARHGITAVPMTTGFVQRPHDSLAAWFPSFHGIALNRVWVYERLTRLFSWLTS